jgi:RecA-family ATPase
LTPKCIVEDYLYADLGILAAPGGTGKTTIVLYEAIHIALGRRLYGLEVVNPGWVLIVTAEDSRERLIARVREVAGGMDLKEQEIGVLRENVLFRDVSGEAIKLIGLDDGNIVLTDLADQIVEAYRDDRPALIVFDPVVSFGVSETRVNDNEQGLVAAARRIRNGLDCAVRLVHHTGQAAAREKLIDQYTSRGGTALPDGSRMVAVMQPWTRKDQNHRPPEDCIPEPGSAITVLARPKLSYATPNLPLIWIKRTGWRFEHFIEIAVSEAEQVRDRLDQVERFLSSEEAAAVFHSRKSLEENSRTLGMTRQENRGALAQLMAEGRVIEKELPKELCRGGKKTFLSATKIRRGLARLEEIGETTSPGNTPPTTSPPYRKKNGGEVTPPLLHPFPRPRREDSAKFSEVGEVGYENDIWEMEI